MLPSPGARVAQPHIPHGAMHGLGHLPCARRIRVGQDHDKLFPAIAGHQVSGPAHVPAQTGRHLFEALVPGLVAIKVVVGLEIVDIHHDKPQGLLFALGALPLAGQGGVEATAVGKTRKAVLHGIFF